MTVIDWAAPPRRPPVVDDRTRHHAPRARMDGWWTRAVWDSTWTPRTREGATSRTSLDSNDRPHGWMTSSARASTDGGMVRPRVFAVLRLMTSSNFFGCSTGRSPGLAPLRILSRRSQPADRGEVQCQYEIRPPAWTYSAPRVHDGEAVLGRQVHEASSRTDERAVRSARSARRARLRHSANAPSNSSGPRPNGCSRSPARAAAV